VCESHVVVGRPGAGVNLPAHVERRHLALAAAGCAAVGVVAVVDPSRTTLAPPCPLRALTGLDCPLCGATRATHALIHGDFATALDFNALYVLALPVVGLLVLLWLVRARIPEALQRASSPWVMLAVAVAFMAVRNLPFEPFAVLGSAVGRQ
jgi:hypothetical protein